MDSTTYQRFPSTHWSLIGRAATNADPGARRQALTDLLTCYLPALRSYLRLVRQMPAADADDLVQAFITSQLLERDLLAHADRSRGRFRSLLLTSLNNFAASRARSKGRAASSLVDDYDQIDNRAADPPAAVQCVWARSLIHQVIQAMRHECQQTERPDIWAVFEGRVLAEVFDNNTCVPYERLAAQLNLDSPTQAANLLVTAKRMYARLLREAVAQYELHPEDIDEEIAALRQTLQSPVPPDA